ncbi:MAG: HDOD domain-containing protein [Desulfobacteraceae bacterium]|jgi:putative nucleotidyltransferase with HDIG domain
MEELTQEKKLKIKQIQTYISKMPSLSTTVTKVLEICNHPNTSPGDLNKVISLDPVLTGKVLKLINSAYYSLPNQVASLTRAIIMLGLNTVKNLALSTAILENLGSTGNSKGLSMDDFWTHSICVGVTAKSVASAVGIPVTLRDEYFLTGLLHDLGKIPLNNRFPEIYMKSLEFTSVKQLPLYKTEEIVLGINHMEVGQMIAEKWQLNDSMKESLYYHHNPEEAKEENRLMVSIIALANACANKFETGTAGDIFPKDQLLLKLLKLTGLEWQTIEEIQETVLVEIDKARVFLQLTKKEE